MSQVRAKFHCDTVEDSGGGNYARFTPVYEGSPENESFYAATPGGQIDLYYVNPAVVFEPGKDYYIDFTEAPE